MTTVPKPNASEIVAARESSRRGRSSSSWTRRWTSSRARSCALAVVWFTNVAYRPYRCQESDPLRRGRVLQTRDVAALGRALLELVRLVRQRREAGLEEVVDGAGGERPGEEAPEAWR